VVLPGPVPHKRTANPHFHFHVLAVDGLEGLERTLQRRVFRAFRRRGLLEEDAAADMLTWQGGPLAEASSALCPACGGEMKILASSPTPRSCRAFSSTWISPTDLPEPDPNFDFDPSLPDSWGD